ncbi:MAG TPA: hypothetical protein VMD09_01935 [Solirubrobacteraceae bacterium]|nr:hypothetical protein [Solirubrobacteraceae bacterium]
MNSMSEYCEVEAFPRIGLSRSTGGIAPSAKPERYDYDSRNAIKEKADKPGDHAEPKERAKSNRNCPSN